MNKQAINSTAIAYWCEEDECFIVQSPLMDSIIGAGDSIEEARNEFRDILSDAYEAYLEGRMSNQKPGRPAKNRIPLNTDLKSATRDGIRKLAEKFECSQGEVIDFLFAFQQHYGGIAIESHNTMTTRTRTKLQQQVSYSEDSSSKPGNSYNHKPPRVSEQTFAAPSSSVTRVLDSTANEKLNNLESRVAAIEATLKKQQKR